MAQSQQQLGQLADAIANLEKARKIGSQDNPPLYIRLLKLLHALYWEQKNYLEAFRVKQERRSIEQQYGLRAFIGAGRIKAQRPAWSALAPAEFQAMIAQEISASGRQQDVDRLIERIGSTQHKLTVLYGQSGVGKSSVVEAGLLPALKQKAIGSRDVLPVRLRVYTHWVKELGHELAQALIDTGMNGEPNPEYDSLDAIEEQLRHNESCNRLTVLIFDQFEEFFFICKKPAERQCFAEFFRDCLNIPFVKIILSLREDYLYLLLRCSRHLNLDAINNNILDKDILYYIGNFSPDDAKSLILKLTQPKINHRSPFYLETDLIDELVKDLAGEQGEVRPIELQVVGAQLQAENITTLAQYQAHGPKPKEKLVQRYLEEVIADCGVEQQQAAELILYLLTDENETRPLKTRAQLERELKALTVDLVAKAERLDLVLKIFVESGLVFLLPEIPADRYQLVHDYLVSFIRHQQEPKLKELVAELEKEREQRHLTEEQLDRVEQANQALAQAIEQLEKEKKQRQFTEQELKRAEQAKQIFAEANQKAKQRMRIGTAVLMACFVLAGVATGIAGWQAELAHQANRELQIANVNLKSTAMVRMGATELQLGRYDEALSAFNSVIRLDPKNDWAWASRGEIYRLMQRYEDALNDFNQAIKLNPNNSLLVAGRGVTYRAMHRYEDALKDFNHALELNPNSDRPLYNRALVYLALGQKDKGQADLTQAIQIIRQHYEKDSQNWQNSGQNWRNGFNLALYSLAAGETTQAEHYYRTLLSQNPPNYVLEQSIRNLDDFLKLFPKHRQAKSMRALLQAAMK